MGSLAHLNKYLRKYRCRLLLGIFFVLCSNALSIAPAVLIRESLDLFATEAPLEGVFADFLRAVGMAGSLVNSLGMYALLILLLAVVKGVCMFFMRQMMIVTSRLIEYDLKNEIYAHYQRLSLHFFRTHNTGDLLTRIAEDVSKVRMYLGPALMYGINTLSLFLLLVPFMYAVNVQLSTYVLVPLPLVSLVIYFVNNLINKQSGKVQQALSRLSTFSQETFSGIRVMKSFAREASFYQLFEKKSETYKQEALRLGRVNALFFPAMLFFSGVSVLLVLYVGSLRVMDATLSVGNMAEFIIYVNLLMWPFASVGWVSSITQQAAASQKRINEFLRTAPTIVSRRALRSPITGHLSFEGVSLRYENTGICALRALTFSIPPRGSVAILGGVGSGKTSLLSLVGRLYDPTEGVVRLDGVALQDYEVRHLRSHVAYVPQDGFLFSDTVSNNILFSLEDEGKQKLSQLIKDAALQEDIDAFSQGLDTMVGERGIKLSGGQRQRVALARALSRDAKLLLLDDCFSAVDVKTESCILQAMKPYLGERTILLATHRVFTARLADSIIILRDGSIQQRGTHEELLASNAYYQAIYEQQMMVE